MVPMRLGHSSSKATVSPAELFARPASTIEVNRAPDHALSRVTMHPPAAAAPRLERAAEKALFRLENDVGAHRELGWTHAWDFLPRCVRTVYGSVLCVHKKLRCDYLGLEEVYALCFDVQ